MRAVAAVGFLVVIAVAVMVATGETREESPFGPPPPPYERATDGKPICPACGRTDQVYPYCYGLISGPRPAGCVLGGCCIHQNSPKYKCLSCGTPFGRYMAEQH